MIFHAKNKVKEGKVVKVEVDCDEVIKDIKITGDFFIHPEEILDEIEKSIIGLERSASIETITSNIKSRIEDRDVQMIGISPESIAMLIREALK
ncbi:MAG: lipoate protein ligase C-terminal domain-containing protein [Candidatus Methanoperedens sp.]|nr:lipoate protein ligase C-terminal domain-containing protein [Candidatus Methanoperedens sp.]